MGSAVWLPGCSTAGSAEWDPLPCRPRCQAAPGARHERQHPVVLRWRTGAGRRSAAPSGPARRRVARILECVHARRAVPYSVNRAGLRVAGDAGKLDMLLLDYPEPDDVCVRASGRAHDKSLANVLAQPKSMVPKVRMASRTLAQCVLLKCMRSHQRQCEIAAAAHLKAHVLNYIAGLFLRLS